VEYRLDASPTVSVDAGERGTRDRVARSILENGPSTAAALAERLELTPAAVRRHLDILLNEDRIVPAAPRLRAAQRGRGRPARAFAITQAGRESFHQAYDELAVGALHYLAKTAGDSAVLAFAESRVADLEERYRDRVSGLPEAERPAALADALSADGYAASARPAPGGHGEQICQHHCPVAHVAEQFPQLCEAETAAFGRLLGSHVQRLATIARGDGVCTTYVPGRTT
jgi:predicted ArsR family transcriptional regulator